MKKNKQLVIGFLSCSIFLFLSFFGVIYYYDPIKVFHKPWVYKNYLHPNMRLQSAGIIKHEKFDSIIIGTSMLENTSANEASKVLGGKFINISLSGSDFFERKIVLDFALKRKKVKKILYSLDTFALMERRVRNPNYSLDKWGYLYDNSLFNDFNFYLNDRFLQCIFVPSYRKQCMGLKITLDRPNAWFNNPRYKQRFGGIENWFKAQGDSQIKEAFKNILGTIDNINKGRMIHVRNAESEIYKSEKYLDRTLISLAKKYPETKFILIIPPYSRIRYALDIQYAESKFFIYQETIKYLVKKSLKYHNIQVFAWGNNTFLDNIANYKDLHHYGHKINSWMLSQIQKNNGYLNSENVDTYFKTFIAKAKSYNLWGIAEKINFFLNKKASVYNHR